MTEISDEAERKEMLEMLGVSENTRGVGVWQYILKDNHAHGDFWRDALCA